MLYFDHNATMPMLPAARQAWLEAAEQFIGNPSSPHRIGARAEAALNQARAEVARTLGCDPLDIVWTSGATESNNTVFYHMARSVHPLAEVWVSAIEHPCVLAAVQREFPKRHRLIPCLRSGVIDLDWLADRLKVERPALVAVMAANNETGVIQPWDQALRICRERDVPFFCDAAQWIGRMDATALGECDFVSGSAHKCGGPKGIGFLKVPARGALRPMLVGGPQEDGRRAGTENVPAAVAFAAALRECEQLRSRNAERESWRGDFERQLLAELPGAQILGHGQPRLWNTVSALMPDTDCRHRWVVKLDKRGYAVSTGSACSSGKEKPSHVLAAMGYDTAAAGRVLRFSSGWDTRQEDWSALLGGLKQVYEELCQPAG